jgi:hypothetical protein
VSSRPLPTPQFRPLRRPSVAHRLASVGQFPSLYMETRRAPSRDSDDSSSEVDTDHNSDEYRGHARSRRTARQDKGSSIEQIETTKEEVPLSLQADKHNGKPRYYPLMEPPRFPDRMESEGYTSDEDESTVERLFPQYLETIHEQYSYPPAERTSPPNVSILKRALRTDRARAVNGEHGELQGSTQSS